MVNIVNICNENYPAVLEEIQIAGFPLDNKLVYMDTLLFIQKVIDDGCWYGLKEDDKKTLEFKFKWFLTQSNLVYTEVIKEIYTNVNNPQTTVEYQRYIDALNRYNLEQVYYRDNPDLIVKCEHPAIGNAVPC